MRRWFLLPVLVLLASCTGDTGPMGPPGPGADVRVYEGTIPSSGTIDVDVPEIVMDNLPLVGVYVGDSSGWIQVNAYAEDTNGDVFLYEYAVLSESTVSIFSLSGVRYRIIVVMPPAGN